MNLEDKHIEKYRLQLDDIKKETSEVLEWATENYKSKLAFNKKPLSMARIKANNAFRKFMDMNSDEEATTEETCDDKLVVSKLISLEKKLNITEMVWKTALNQMSDIVKSQKKSENKITSELLPKFPLKNIEEFKRFEMICRCFPEAVDDDLKNIFDNRNLTLKDYVMSMMGKIMTVECGVACSWTGSDGYRLKDTKLMNLMLRKLIFMNEKLVFHSKKKSV